MNKCMIIILCELCLMLALRPVFPFLEYALNYDYISENLCINRDKPESHCKGKCHLKKRLQEVNGGKTSSGHTSAPAYSVKEHSPGIVEIIDLQFFRRNNQKNHFFFYSYSSKEFFSSLLTPPPKAFLPC